MNCNISPIAFYTSRAAQAWRSGYYQRNIAVVVGDSLPAFIINNAPTTAPDSVQIFDPNTDTLVATVSCTDIIAHTSTVDGVSVNSWIYQATSSGIWGFVTPGYYYLKIGNYYSDIIKFGAVVGDYVKLTYQFFDDIITPDGTLISKYIVYQQIFETILWHPSYETTEEGKENNGIFYAMQQTLKKMCGFTEIVNVAQLDTLNLTRMADEVTIEARSNGVIRNFHTNTFEIKEKWESDEVASIDVSFDLFNIVRKYQKSNVAPEPLPVPTPPTPTGNYYIRGTASGNSVTLKINGTNTPVQVYNDAFVYAYDDKLTAFEAHDSNILTITFADSCKMTNVTTFSMEDCRNMVSADFTGCTFHVCSSAVRMFRNCLALTSLSMPNADFSAYGCGTDYMFENCNVITSISMPIAIFGATYIGMFKECNALHTINLPLATFDLGGSAKEMFYKCRMLKNITMTSARFSNCKSWEEAFVWNGYDMDNFVFTDIFPAYSSLATNQPTTMAGAFKGCRFKKIDISAIDLSACTDMEAIFIACQTLTQLSFDKSHTNNVTNWYNAFGEIGYQVYSYLSDVDMSGATDIDFAFVIIDDENTGATNQTLKIDATFANVTSASRAFKGSSAYDDGSDVVSTINLPNATFANCEDFRYMLQDNLSLETINIPNLLVKSTANIYAMFANLPELKNVTVGQSGTLPSSVSFAQSPLLTEASITNIVAWLKDLTGETAKTLTINSTAWSNLPSASQSSLAAAITAKNWNLQN